MNPTIRQVAELADVSVGTVDRVIHNRGRVKLHTKEKIEKIIKELNYKPNVFARNLALKPSFNIAVLMPNLDQDGGYWQLPISGINQAYKNLQHYNLDVTIFHYNKLSESSFKTEAKKIIQGNFNGVLLAPILMDATRWFLSQLPPTMPYVFFDTGVPGAECLSTVHQNSYYGGRVGAELMNMIIHSDATISIIQFLPHTIHIDERSRGFLEYLNEIEGLNIITTEIPENSSKDEVNRIFSELCRQHKNLKGVFVTGSHIYEIAQCLIERKSNDKIHLIGFDLIPDNIKFLREGTIDIVISQSPDLQGFTGIYTLYRKLAHKDKIDKEIILPIEIITKGNLDFFLESRIAKENRQKAVSR